MVKKNILVTGAAGFIGFHVALALKKRGDHVVGIDNFNSYYSPHLKRARETILKEHGVEIVEGEITNPTLLSNLVENNRCTHLLNLAAQAGVRYAREHPEVYLKSNVEGFLTILELCRRFPALSLVYASSSSVYGCNDKIPFSLTDTTDRPANFYAVTKKTNELMAYSYAYLYGIKSIGLRYFTVYGPWGRPDMAYFSFTKDILNNQEISLFNEGNMKRDFTFIDDAVSGTLAAIDLSPHSATIYNIGNHRPEPILKLVSLLEEKLKKKAKIRLLGPSIGEVETTFADITSAQKDLKFSPKVSLEEGIDHFISWYTSFNT